MSDFLLPADGMPLGLITFPFPQWPGKTPLGLSILPMLLEASIASPPSPLADSALMSTICLIPQFLHSLPVNNTSMNTVCPILQMMLKTGKHTTVGNKTIRMFLTFGKMCLCCMR
jgi:hypothetical protein